MLFRLVMLALVGSALAVGGASAADQRPFRGAVKLSVLLCKYKDAPTPARAREFYEDLLINRGTGGHADFWADVSYGSIVLDGSVVRGWYTVDRTADQARAADPWTRFSGCVDEARRQGYTAPDDHLTVVITSPDVGTFGFQGGAFLGEAAEIGAVAHEVGHGFGLNHSHSDDTGVCMADWAYVAEYDNQWDLMSFANVFAKQTGVYGGGGPGLNAYHLDRMGWLPRGRILRFGEDGVYDRTVTLNAPTSSGANGYRLVRIPFDPADPNRYYTVEYRVPQGWDAGFPRATLLIHEVDDKALAKCNGEPPGQGYRSYLQRSASGSRAPLQKIDRNGVSILLVGQNAGTGEARVRIRSTLPQLCVQGLVWREASPSDKVCVSQARRAAVAEENRRAADRRRAGGGASGPDTCRNGFVWRESSGDDRVCVRPASRELVRKENERAWENRLGGAVYGPNTCKAGFVWRDADESDWVCVPPGRREAALDENRQAASRRQPAGGAYGADTCREGFVWREAFPNDRVCVTRARRDQVQDENRRAHDRLANGGA